jgi:hypothetical protein
MKSTLLSLWSQRRMKSTSFRQFDSRLVHLCVVSTVFVPVSPIHHLHESALLGQLWSPS